MWGERANHGSNHDSFTLVSGGISGSTGAEAAAWASRYDAGYVGRQASQERFCAVTGLLVHASLEAVSTGVVSLGMSTIASYVLLALLWVGTVASAVVAVVDRTSVSSVSFEAAQATTAVAVAACAALAYPVPSDGFLVALVPLCLYDTFRRSTHAAAAAAPAATGTPLFRAVHAAPLGLAFLAACLSVGLLFVATEGREAASLRAAYPVARTIVALAAARLAGVAHALAARCSVVFRGFFVSPRVRAAAVLQAHGMGWGDGTVSLEASGRSNSYILSTPSRREKKSVGRSVPRQSQVVLFDCQERCSEGSDDEDANAGGGGGSESSSAASGTFLASFAAVGTGVGTWPPSSVATPLQAGASYSPRNDALGGRQPSLHDTSSVVSYLRMHQSLNSENPSPAGSAPLPAGMNTTDDVLLGSAAPYERALQERRMWSAPTADGPLSPRTRALRAPPSPLRTLQSSKATRAVILSEGLREARNEVRDLISPERQGVKRRASLGSLAMSKLKHKTLANIVSLISRLSEEVDVVRINNLIVAGVCELLSCDRASVFLVDGRFVRSFDDNGREIKVRTDKSLVGHSALNFTILNIPDAYVDPRFNKEVDKKTGYRTRSVLVYPIVRSEVKHANKQHGVFAIIEAINKQNEKPFTDEDEEILALLGKQAGVLLSNSHYCQQLESASYKTSTLLEVSKEISDVQVDLGQMMEKIMMRARQVLTVERASVFLIDEAKKELWSILTDSEMANRSGDNVIRLPVGVGIAGTVAKTGVMLNISDVYSSPLFNPEFDKVSGFSTKNCLCVPVTVASQQGRVIGVMQYINKNNGHPFDSEDCSLATTFSTFVGISLNNLLLYDELREGQLVREQNKELIRLRDKAKQAAEAKANFLMSMSHEIRTPMSGVLGMTELLEQTTRLDKEQEEMVTTIKNCGESLLGIINDILDYGRLESGKLELEIGELDLLDLSESTIEVVRGKAEQKQIAMHLRVAPDLNAGVLGDSFRLKQVLINLLGNAVKFTPERGEIVLSVGLATPTDLDRSLRTYRRISKAKSQLIATPNVASRNVCFKVRDTGIGIPKENQSSLFLPFHQASAGTTRQYGGSGLGLSICKQLLEVMGGDIFVESEEKQGSTFSVVVPFAQSQKTPMLFAASLRREYGSAGNMCVHVVAGQLQQDTLCGYFTFCDAPCSTFDTVDALCEKLLAGTSEDDPPGGLVLLDQSSLRLTVEGTCDAVARIVHCLSSRSKLCICVLAWMVHKGTLVEQLTHLSTEPLDAEDPDKRAKRLYVLSTPPKFSQLCSVLQEVSWCMGAVADNGSGGGGNGPRFCEDSVRDDLPEDAGDGGSPRLGLSIAGSCVEPPVASKSIVVAEDNPTNQLLIKKQLRMFGVEPTICDNGMAVLEEITRTRCDLILMGNALRLLCVHLCGVACSSHPPSTQTATCRSSTATRRRVASAIWSGTGF